MSEKEMQGGQSIQEQYKEMGERKKNAKKLSTKVKGHLKRHKTKYIVGGVGLTAGVGIGYCLHMRFGVNISPMSVGMDVVNTVSPKNTIVGRDNSITNDVDITNNVTNVINMGGHVKKIVRRMSDGRLFDGVNEAAEEAGVSQSLMSNHLNGRREHVNGDIYEIAGLATK